MSEPEKPIAPTPTPEDFDYYDSDEPDDDDLYLDEDCGMGPGRILFDGW